MMIGDVMTWSDIQTVITLSTWVFFAWVPPCLPVLSLSFFIYPHTSPSLPPSDLSLSLFFPYFPFSLQTHLAMSAAVAAAAAAATAVSRCSSTNSSNNTSSSDVVLLINHHQHHHHHHHQQQSAPASLSRYESQKRRDWNTFGQYLKNHRPPLTLSRCSGAHVLEFLRYLDQFGKTKVHADKCPFYGQPHPPAPCPCPLKQAWGSLDALIGRLRAAFEENGGQPETNPFGARAVRLYLREVRDSQAKARGIAYEKKKRKKPGQQNIIISSTSNSTTPFQSMPSALTSVDHHHHNHHHHNLVVDQSKTSKIVGSASSNGRSSINSMIPLSVLN